jgi:hypothetical protein
MKIESIINKVIIIVKINNIMIYKIIIKTIKNKRMYFHINIKIQFKWCLNHNFLKYL